ncbi:MAG: hypothetical protein AAGH64_06005 [Planctomycetota bacterium]
MRTHTLALALLTTPGTLLASELTHEGAAELAKTMAHRETLLVSAGVGEATPLRYTPAPDAALSYELTQTLTLIQNAPPAPTQTVDFPRTTYRFTSTVTETPDGAPFVVESVLDDVRIDEETDPMIAGAVGDMLASMAGMTTTERVDRRGTTTDLSSTLPPGANPGAREQIDQIRALAGRVILPDEPVGVGATWRHKTDQDAGGFDVSVITTYTLTERTDTAITLDMTIHQLIPEQPLDAPGLPPGATATITDAKGFGTGTMVVDLATAQPARLDMTFELDMSVDASMQPNAMVTATT